MTRLRDLGLRPMLALFVLAIGFYVYFYQAGGWNQNSRFDLVRALVEGHTSSIDAFHLNTGDKAFRDGRYYCDKAPGLSWFMTPSYALLYAVAGDDEPQPPFLALASYLATVVAVAFPSALCLLALFQIAGGYGLSTGTSALLALAYGLGTMAWPYSTLMYGHQPAAAMLLIGFALLIGEKDRERPGPEARFRLLSVGLLFGAAVVIEYPAILGVIVLTTYGMATLRPWWRTGWIVVGGLGPALAMLLYHSTVFGGPLVFPYHFSTQVHRAQGFMGMGAPDPALLWQILVPSFRGLLYSAPWLALAIPGAAVLLARPAWRREAAACCTIVLLFLWMNASLVDWEGGWTFGPRYLLPALPFLAILAGGILLPAGASPATLRRGLAWTGLPLVVYSFVMMLVATAVKPEVPMGYLRPFGDFLWPRFAAGQLSANTQSIDGYLPIEGAAPQAWNLGMHAGLGGGSSLLPLLIFGVICAVWLHRACRSGGTP